MTTDPHALHQAAGQGDLQTLITLLNSGVEIDGTVDKGFTALTVAAAARQLDALQLLIARGANVNARGGVGRQVLWVAALNEANHGDIGIVRALLDAGADVNLTSSWGETALFAASFFPRGLSTIRLLLERGADVNIACNRGRTPLMEAASVGQIEIVRTLLDYGADLTARDEQGFTAQTIAAEDRHIDVEKLLIELSKHV